MDPPLNTTSENEMNKIYNLPDDIKPKMKSHRFEIIFWGVRDMKKINCISINKPKIILECSGIQIVSEVIENYKKYSNFNDNHVIIDLVNIISCFFVKLTSFYENLMTLFKQDLPELDIYYPPITIKAFDSRSFGYSYVGVCIIPTAHIFLKNLITQDDYFTAIYNNKNNEFFNKNKSTDIR